MEIEPTIIVTDRKESYLKELSNGDLFLYSSENKTKIAVFLGKSNFYSGGVRGLIRVIGSKHVSALPMDSFITPVNVTVISVTPK